LTDPEEADGDDADGLCEADGDDNVDGQVVAAVKTKMAAMSALVMEPSRSGVAKPASWMMSASHLA